MPQPQVLVPYNRAEAIPAIDATRIAGRTLKTIQKWAVDHHIGRKVGSRWEVSLPALLMFLDGNREALDAYLAGDRQSDRIRLYFARAGVALPEAA